MSACSTESACHHFPGATAAVVSDVWAEKQARDGAQTPPLPATPLIHLHHQDAEQLSCSQDGKKKPRVKDEIKGRT